MISPQVTEFASQVFIGLTLAAVYSTMGFILGRVGRDSSKEKEKCPQHIQIIEIKVGSRIVLWFEKPLTPTALEIVKQAFTDLGLTVVRIIGGTSIPSQVTISDDTSTS